MEEEVLVCHQGTLVTPNILTNTKSTENLFSRQESSIRIVYTLIIIIKIRVNLLHCNESKYREALISVETMISIRHQAKSVGHKLWIRPPASTEELEFQQITHTIFRDRM